MASQRGVAGWNDCPPVMTRNFSGGSFTKRRNNEDDSSNSFMLETWILVSSDKDISIEEVLPKLERLFSHPSKLLQKEFDHYKEKLTTSVPNFSKDHLEFLDGVLDGVEEFMTNGLIKNDILKEVVNFMMVNDGVSKWCTPLRKVIEKIDK